VNLDCYTPATTLSGSCVVPYNILGGDASRIFLMCQMYKVITNFAEEDKLNIGVGKKES
jgi:hypothetical protein